MTHSPYNPVRAMASSPLRKRIVLITAASVVLVGGAGAVFALSTWNSVNRVSIDRPVTSTLPSDEAKEGNDRAPDQKPQGEDKEEPVFLSPSGGLDVFLLVGSDSRAELESIDGFGNVPGTRADVIMVLLRTESQAAVLSLPRDLWVEDMCGGGEARINRMLEGCGESVNGPTLLTLSVESLIGETVDHFALVDLAGFQDAVDAIGGYEICVENPVRDERANLHLPSGCTHANGEQTLAWLRSRRTQELTDEGWRTMPGVSDLARNDRQRVFLIDMMSNLADITSPQALAFTAQAVAPYVTVDSELSLVTAVNLAWTMRGYGAGSVAQLELPVLGFTTDEGAAVLVPQTPVDEIVAEFTSLQLSGGLLAQGTD